MGNLLFRYGFLLVLFVDFVLGRDPMVSYGKFFKGFG